jgi:hypothetical protein
MNFKINVQVPSSLTKVYENPTVRKGAVVIAITLIALYAIKLFVNYKQASSKDKLQWNESLVIPISQDMNLKIPLPTKIYSDKSGKPFDNRKQAEKELENVLKVQQYKWVEVKKYDRKDYLPPQSVDCAYIHNWTDRNNNVEQADLYFSRDFNGVLQSWMVKLQFSKEGVVEKVSEITHLTYKINSENKYEVNSSYVMGDYKKSFEVFWNIKPFKPAWFPKIND